MHFSLNRRAFAYYNPAVHEWEVNSGYFDVLVGGSLRDLPLQAAVDVRGTSSAVKTLTRHSMIKEFRDYPPGQAFYAELVKATGFTSLLEPEATEGLSAERIAARSKAHAAELAFIGDMPVSKLPAFSCGAFPEAQLNEILQAVAAQREE